MSSPHLFLHSRPHYFIIIAESGCYLRERQFIASVDVLISTPDIRVHKGLQQIILLVKTTSIRKIEPEFRIELGSPYFDTEKSN